MLRKLVGIQSSARPGDELDGYRVVALIARSGMTSVFRGTDFSGATERK
jgi:hypothetical protein